METCNVTHEIIEAVSCNLSCSVKVDAVKTLHNIGVIGNLEVGNYRLTETLKLNIFAVVLTNGNGRVNDVGDSHHYLLDLFSKLGLLNFKLSKAVAEACYLSLDFLSLFLLALTHKSADLLGKLVSLSSQLISLLLCSTGLSVQVDYLVNKRKLAVLKLLLDIFFYDVGIFSDKFDIQHFFHSFYKYDIAFCEIYNYIIIAI